MKRESKEEKRKIKEEKMIRKSKRERSGVMEEFWFEEDWEKMKRRRGRYRIGEIKTDGKEKKGNERGGKGRAKKKYLMEHSQSKRPAPSVDVTELSGAATDCIDQRAPAGMSRSGSWRLQQRAGGHWRQARRG